MAVLATLLPLGAALAADCEFTALEAGALGPRQGLDWRSWAAPIGGFIAATGVLLWLLWLSGGRRAGALAAVASGFNRRPRAALVGYLLLSATAISLAYTALARLPAPAGERRIEVTCYAGMRLYRYPGTGVAYLSRDLAASLGRPPGAASGGQAERSLIVPAGTRIRLQVMNFLTEPSWWREFLGARRPALPRLGEELLLGFDAPGEHRGSCRSVCPGVSAASPLRIQVLEPAAFARWLDAGAERPPPRWAAAGFEQLMRDGDAVYRRRCAACHGADGGGVPGMFPGLRGSAMIRGPLENHLVLMWWGKPGSPMKAFGEELSLYEMAAVMTFQRNAWGAPTGDAIQAADVQALVSALAP